IAAVAVEDERLHDLAQLASGRLCGRLSGRRPAGKLLDASLSAGGAEKARDALDRLRPGPGHHGPEDTGARLPNVTCPGTAPAPTLPGASRVPHAVGVVHPLA